MIEQLNKDLRRRIDVVWVLRPHGGPALPGRCRLVEVHDGWQAGERRYLPEGSMT
jgi:hypothetical protein